MSNEVRYIDYSLWPDEAPELEDIKRYAHDTDVDYWTRKADYAQTNEDIQYYEWFIQNARFLRFLGLD